MVKAAERAKMGDEEADIALQIAADDVGEGGTGGGDGGVGGGGGGERGSVEK